MPEITFHAKTLDDIARHFERLALAAEERQLGAKIIQGKLFAREAYVWRQAAGTLRQTVLVPEHERWQFSLAPRKELP